MSKKSTTKKKETILTATHGSPEKQLLLGERQIQCYVLEDGTAVLSGRGMQDALGFGKTASGRGHGAKLGAFFNNKLLKPFIDEDLARVIDNPIRFIRPGRGGSVAKGYQATVLTQICRAVLKARRAGAFENSPLMQRIADECEIIVAAFSDVGIIATIYEVTGYEKDKEIDSYQKYLEKFIRKDYAAWVRRFPIKFFERMCDLKGWEYVKNKTRYIPAMGHVINDVIYSRLAPNILSELKKANPVDKEKGRRAQHHTQWLTEDIGIPSLAEHIIGVMALASANTQWNKFVAQLNRVYPIHKVKQLYLDLPDTEDQEDIIEN